MERYIYLEDEYARDEGGPISIRIIDTEDRINDNANLRRRSVTIALTSEYRHAKKIVEALNQMKETER
jgi:hypothetical protein